MHITIHSQPFSKLPDYIKKHLTKYDNDADSILIINHINNVSTLYSKSKLDIEVSGYNTIVREISKRADMTIIDKKFEFYIAKNRRNSELGSFYKSTINYGPSVIKV